MNKSIIVIFVFIFIMNTYTYTKEPSKNVVISGNIKGIGKGQIYVVLYPVNLGVFDDYDVSPISIKCNDSGKFTSDLLPAGIYTIKGYEDLNNNGLWDGNWLSAEPEPIAILKNVKLEKDKTTNIALELKMPVKGLPKPIYDEHPEFIELYNSAWEFAREKISKGNTQNGFVHAYMDEGFNEYIYQWDTCFMMFFGVYGGNDFPAMNSVDNFYYKQRADGFISRVYNELTGEGLEPNKNDPHINPPLFAWTEYNYYRITGDNSRLLWAISHNHKYFQWIKNNCRTNKGFYFITNFGSGMDNSPREGFVDGWIDITSQMALFALYMQKLCVLAGLNELSEKYEQEHIKISQLINKYMWDDKIGMYFDIRKDGTLHKKKTIGSFWTMIARVSPKERINRLVEHLKNPNEFATPHLFPTLSKDEEEYDSKGYYWRGSVWAPTNFMVIKGLEYNGFEDFAREASLNHINNMLDVYKNFIPDKNKLPYDNPNVPFPKDLDGSKQIWECYSPENKEPATRWDNQYYVRPKFVGWSGLGPIVLFIENVIGIKLDAFENKIVWNINSDKPNGVKQLPFNLGYVDLVMRGIVNGKPEIDVKSDIDFTLEIKYKNKTWVEKIKH